MPSRRRVAWVAAVAVGVLAVAAGAVIGYLGYENSSGPDGAVRGYFAALQAGDAPRALSWGDVPSGPHTLLTSQVLRAQLQIAPIRDVRLGSIQHSGSLARVAVGYTLGFPGADAPEHATLEVVDRDGDWRLRQVAIPTQLLLDSSVRRARLLGGGVPQGETLVFPGAVPVSFDTPYLQLDPAQDAVGFGSGPVVEVSVQLSDAGRDAVRTAVGRALTRCVDGHPDVSCPVPSARYVPGSVAGRLGSDSLDDLSITLADGDDGLITVSGTVPVSGTFRRLTFANRSQSGSGTVQLAVHARTYAVAPLRVDWTSS